MLSMVHTVYIGMDISLQKVWVPHHFSYPASRAFLSGKSFSMCKVVRVSGISRCWFV